LGLVFGMLAFMRTNAYRAPHGQQPWHIHPLVWGLVSVFVAFLVTLLSIVFVAIFGTVLSIFAWAPRSQPSREPGATASLVSGIGPMAGAQPAPPLTALRAWLADPTGRHELRYFDGQDGPSTWRTPGSSRSTAPEEPAGGAAGRRALSVRHGGVSPDLGIRG